MAKFKVRKRAPKGFDDLWIYVEDFGLIFMQEGDGTQLLWEDREDGYIDYVDFQSYEGTPDDDKYEAEDGELSDIDGGIHMYKEYIEDKFEKLADVIPDVFWELDIPADTPYVYLK